MGVLFSAESLELQVGRKWHIRELPDPLVLVLGPVGTGKSSLCEVFWYTLGLPATLVPAVANHVFSTRVTIRIGSRRLRFERLIRRGDSAPVRIYDLDQATSTGTFPVTRGAEQPSISDFLMDALGIPRVPLPGGSDHELTFEHVQSVLYLGQARIANSLFGRDRTVLHPHQVIVLDVLLGAYNPQVSEMRREVNRIRHDLSKNRASQSGVQQFLDKADIPSDVALRAQMSELAQRRDRLIHEIDVAAKRRDDAALVEHDLRQAAQLIQKRWSQESERLDTLRRRAADLTQNAAAAQLKLTSRSAARRTPTHCSHCQQCLPALSPDEAGHCPQCRQPLPAGVGGPDTDPYLERLQSALRAAQAALTQVEAQRVRAQDLLSGTGDEIVAAARNLERHQQDTIRPLDQVIGTQRERLAQTNQGLAALEPLAAQRAALVQRQARVEDAKGHLARVVDGLRSAEAEVAATRKSIAAELTELFALALAAMGMPGRTAPRIDPNTYSPFLGPDGFDRLAVSGGRKTITNLAVHLGLVQFAARHPEICLPAFLMIDSPREGIGAHNSDRGIARGVYEHVATLLEDHQWPQAPQLIIADNDAAVSINRRIPSIRLSYHAALVPGIAHPGPGEVATAEDHGDGH
jgi:hypothetical protein